jgi:hypothetical protein
MSKAKPISVTRAAVTLLVQGLTQPGWTQSTADLYRAGKLADSLESTYEADPEPEGIAGETVAAATTRFRSWANREVQVGVTDKDQDTIRTCLRFLAKEGKIRPTRHYVSLAEALGLTEKE